MTLRTLISACLIVLFCSGLLVVQPSASAASKPKKDDHGAPADSHGEKDSEPQPGDENYTPPRSSNMPMLLIPAVVDGRKSHYIFVSYRLVMHTEMQVDKVNQKIAWLHDAFLREVYKTNPIDPENSNQVDKTLLEKRFREIANDLLHDDVVKSVYFMSTVSEKDPIHTEYQAPRRVGSSHQSKGSSGH